MLIELAGTRRGFAPRRDRTPNRNPPASGNAEPYDPFKDPEKARKREGWPAFEAPHKRRSRQSPRFEDCPPRASLSSPSEVCSFAPTQRKAAHGSSQIPAG